MSDTNALIMPIPPGLVSLHGVMQAMNDRYAALTSATPADPGQDGRAHRRNHCPHVTAGGTGTAIMSPSRSQPPGYTLLRSALALAARGWHVFPCAPGGKRPAMRGNWQDLATADPDQVRAWWNRKAYNIGVACGPSGLVVIDLDTLRTRRPGCPESGTDVLAALCHQHARPYPLPTYTVATPRGCHLYYTAPDRPIRNSAGRLGPLIDVRADGGYVIGTGSRIGGRAYTVRDERTPVPLPAWIAELLRSNAPAAAGKPRPVFQDAHGTSYAMAALREEARLVATARPGTRNDTLNKAAFSLGQLTAVGLLPPLAVASVLADAAQRAGLPESEAHRTIVSGMTAGARKPRVTGLGPATKPRA